MQLKKKFYALFFGATLLFSPIHADALDYIAQLASAGINTATNYFFYKCAAKIWDEHPRIVAGCCVAMTAVFVIKVINSSYKTKKTKPKPAAIGF